MWSNYRFSQPKGDFWSASVGAWLAFENLGTDSQTKVGLGLSVKSLLTSVLKLHNGVFIKIFIDNK